MAVPKAGTEPLPDLAAFLEPFADLVHRSESREAMERYTTGLLSDLQRKNASEMGRSLPATSGQKLQEFLTRTRWDPGEMDRLRIERMCRDAAVGSGALVIDDTGFAKKGRSSVGVTRQYSGTLGRVDNCQILVTSHYVDRVFDWPVTGQLYVPKSWAEDAQRRERAQVPEGIAFQTKGEIALHLVDQALAAEVPFEAVVADAGYGDQPSFLNGLEARERPYLVGVSITTPFRLAEEVESDPGDPPPPPYTGQGRPRHASRLKDRIPAREAQRLFAERIAQEWTRVAWREGSRGVLVKEAARLRVYRSGTRGDALPSAGWLIAERGVRGDDPEIKFSLAWGLDELGLEELIELVHVRWVVERFYQDAKGQLGLDQYEGRLWQGFHRHIALVMLAHCYLTLRQAYGATGKSPPPDSGGERRKPPPARGFPPGGSAQRGRAPARRYH
jgi:SRSO17 transposase